MLFRKFSKMRVGNQRGCFPSSILPSLHLSCQHWSLLCRGLRKTKLECLRNVLTHSNLKYWKGVSFLLAYFHLLHLFHKMQVFQKCSYDTPISLSAYSGFIESLRSQVLGMFAGWIPGAGIVFHGRSFSGDDHKL